MLNDVPNEKTVRIQRKSSTDSHKILYKISPKCQHQLSDWLAGIIWQRGDSCCEIFCAYDLVAWESSPNKGFRIEPPERCAFDCAVEQIKTVNVKKCFQAATP